MSKSFRFLLGGDCETTGVCIGNHDPCFNEKTGEHHQTVSWGLLVIDTDTLDIIEEKYILVKWNEESIAQHEADPTFGTYAEKIHGLSKEYLDENGVSEEDAVVEIMNLILKYWGNKSPISMLGHNVTFDIRFLKDLFDKFDIHVRFSQRNVDSFSVGFTNWRAFDSDELFDTVLGKKRKEHNALEDIKFTWEAIKLTRTIFEEALDG